MQLHGYNCNSDMCVIKKKKLQFNKEERRCPFVLIDVIKKLIKINLPKNI